MTFRLPRRATGALLAWAMVAVVAMPAFAQAEAVAARQPLGFKQMFLLLFLMLGPIKILGPFVALTRDFDAARRNRLANRAILFSAAALAVAALLGRGMLENYSVPTPVLSLTGGLVLFLVALKTVLEQFSGGSRPAVDPNATDRQLAINPLAFPTIVTPYGIAATIVFMALAEDDLAGKFVVGGAILLILTLDWLAMRFAQFILTWVGTTLQVLAVVLGVTQVAIGLQVILSSLSHLGVFALRVP